MAALHDDEFSIDAALVRCLVDDAQPHFAHLPLTRLDVHGSTNVLFRLGDELLVRLPRQPGGGASIDVEARWLGDVGAAVPVAVPEVVAHGEAAHGYPARWSIVRWIEGERGTTGHDGVALAEDFADVLRALGDLDVPSAARDDPRLRRYRGESLAGFDDTVRACLEQCRAIDAFDLDVDAALALWSDAVALPDAPSGVRWFHGDLVAENLLVRDGRLVGVLDFGGLGVGDPTVDLHGAWELFTPRARDAFRARLDVDDVTWLRGRAWALGVAAVAWPYYRDTLPTRARDRLAMARAVLDDARGG